MHYLNYKHIVMRTIEQIKFILIFVTGCIRHVILKPVCNPDRLATFIILEIFVFLFERTCGLSWQRPTKGSNIGFKTGSLF